MLQNCSSTYGQYVNWVDFTVRLIVSAFVYFECVYMFLFYTFIVSFILCQIFKANVKLRIESTRFLITLFSPKVAKFLKILDLSPFRLKREVPCNYSYHP